MTLFGFAPAETVVVEDNYEPKPPEEPKAKYGDVYQLGRHRLMCGDSTSIDDVTKLVDGQMMDMLLTDPPYNVDYEGVAGKIQNDKMKSEEFRQFLSDAISCAVSAMKPGSVFYIWHASSKAQQFFEACDDCGLEVRQVLIWIKDRFVLGRQDFQWAHEPCMYGEVPGLSEEETADVDASLYGWTEGAHHWYKNRKQKTVLEFDRPNASRQHPTMKPVLLFDYQIKCNTKEGDNVLDLFGGSGTTIIAAEQDGRNAFVMELDPKYVDVIIDRWETLTGEKAVLLNG